MLALFSCMCLSDLIYSSCRWNWHVGKNPLCLAERVGSDSCFFVSQTLSCNAICKLFEWICLCSRSKLDSEAKKWRYALNFEVGSLQWNHLTPFPLIPYQTFCWRSQRHCHVHGDIGSLLSCFLHLDCVHCRGIQGKKRFMQLSKCNWV